MRVSLREQRAALIAEGKEIPPELLNAFFKDDKDEKKLDDAVYMSMQKVLEAVQSHKDAWPFAEPITETVAPDYADVIEVIRVY